MKGVVLLLVLLVCVRGVQVTLNAQVLMQLGTSGYYWSNATIWSPRAPLANDDVFIDISTFEGCGQPLVVDVSTPRLKSFRIAGANPSPRLRLSTDSPTEAPTEGPTEAPTEAPFIPTFLCASSVVLNPSVVLWADQVLLSDANTRLLLTDPTSTVAAEFMEQSQGACIGGSGVFTSATSIPLLSELRGVISPGQTQIRSCTSCWPGMGSTDIYGDLTFHGSAVLQPTSTLVLRSAHIADQPSSGRDYLTDSVRFDELIVNASIVKVVRGPLFSPQNGVFGAVRWLQRSIERDFDIGETGDCWTLENELKCCDFCEACLLSPCATFPKAEPVVCPFGNLNEFSVLLANQNLCTSIRRGDIILSQHLKIFDDGEPILFRDPSIWLPRPPRQGDNITIDLTMWRGCPFRCETARPATDSAPWILVDQPTERFNLLSVVSDHAYCRTSVVIATGATILANEIRLFSKSRLFLDVGSRLTASLFTLDTDSFLGGYGLIDATQSVIGGSIYPGSQRADSCRFCWARSISGCRETFGDLSFRGTALLQSTAWVWVRLAERSQYEQPNFARIFVNASYDAVLFDHVILDGVRLWSWDYRSYYGSNATLPAFLHWKKVTLLGGYSIAPESDGCEAQVVDAFSCCWGCACSVACPSCRDPTSCPVSCATPGDGTALSVTLTVPAECPAEVCDPSCQNGVCLRQIAFCSCDAGYSGRDCSLKVGDATSNNSSDSLPTTSAAQEGSQGPIVAIIVGSVIGAAVVIAIIGALFFRWRHLQAMRAVRAKIAAVQGPNSGAVAMGALHG